MISLFIKVPILGILTALLSVVAEQLLAVAAEMFWHKEIILSFYSQLSYFLVAAAIIEEILKFLAIRFPLRKNFGLTGLKFVFGSLMMGFFFGLSEVWLVTVSNENFLPAILNLNSETLILLSTIILVQTLTALLTGTLIASHIFDSRFGALKILLFPILVHLLFNFLIIQKGNFTNWLVAIALTFSFLISVSVLAINFRKLD